jgi:hypothetical protein
MEIEIMATTVQVGTIFIEDRPLIMRPLDLKSESYSGGWGVLQSYTSSTLDQKIRGTGWNFFFMADEVKASAFGALAAKSIRRALKQIFANIKDPDSNCLEITQIIEKRFWGIPYITICAHSRHIQQGCMLEFARGSTKLKNI